MTKYTYLRLMLGIVLAFVTIGARAEESLLNEIYQNAAATLLTEKMKQQGGVQAHEILQAYLTSYNAIVRHAEQYFYNKSTSDFSSFDNIITTNYGTRLREIDEEYREAKSSIAPQTYAILQGSYNNLTKTFQEELAATKLNAVNMQLKKWRKMIKPVDLNIIQNDPKQLLANFTQETENIARLFNSIFAKPSDALPTQLRRPLLSIVTHATGPLLKNQLHYINKITLDIVQRIQNNLFNPIVVQSSTDLCASAIMSTAQSIYETTGSFVKKLAKNQLLNDTTIGHIRQNLNSMKMSLDTLEKNEQHIAQMLDAVNTSVKTNQFITAYAQLKMIQPSVCKQRSAEYQKLQSNIFIDQIELLHHKLSTFNMENLSLFYAGAHPVDELMELQLWLKDCKFGFADEQFKDNLNAAITTKSPITGLVKNLQNIVRATFINIIKHTIFNNIPEIEKRIIAWPPTMIEAYAGDIRVAIARIKDLYNTLKNYSLIATDDEQVMSNYITLAENELGDLRNAITKEYQRRQEEIR